MDATRVGMIGTGWMAREHLRVIDGLDEAELVAAADIDLSRAEAFVASSRARAYQDWRELVDREDLDALFVCVPPAAHKAPVLEALSRRLPVYLEKPVARSLEDAAEIVEAAAAGGAICAVGYQWHALDILEDLRRMLDDQEIGLLVGTSVGPTESRPWFLERSAGGGNLLERGSHHIDLARRVGGEVASAQAMAGSVRLARSQGGGGDIDDAVVITLELTSGAVANIVVAWTRPDQPGTYALDVVATQATLRLELDPDFKLCGTSKGDTVALKSASHPLEASQRSFFTAVENRDPSLVACTPADAARSLAVALAA
ncbi:MAG: Gfo/Idh/MocA family protein, partial [Acidimicrobiales bacterium]